MRHWQKLLKSLSFRVLGYNKHMTDGFTALIFAVGLGGWVYSYFMKNTMRQQPSLMAAGVAGVAGFIVIFTLMKYVLHY